MKKLIIIISIALVSCNASGQLTTYQKSQVSGMIATAIAPLKTDIANLKIQVAANKVYADSVTASIKWNMDMFYSQLSVVRDNVKSNKVYADSVTVALKWNMDMFYSQMIVIKDSVNSLLSADLLVSPQLSFVRSGVDNKTINISIPDLAAALLRLQNIEAILNRLNLF